MIKIEVEGLDGSGKTSCCAELKRHLEAMGYKTLVMQEAGFKKIDACVQMRKLALDPESNITPLTMELLFAAQRVENDRWLREDPEAHQYDVIVSDRGYASHLAYGYSGVGEHTTQVLFMAVLCDVKMPDAIIYLDISAEEAAKRLKSRGETADRIEALGIEHQEEVAGHFDRVLDGHKGQIKIIRIDASKTKEKVSESLKEALDALSLNLKLK